jgi:integrase
MAGRAPRITQTNFRNAALKAKSTADRDVADILGVNRSNVNRWKKKPENVATVKEVENLLATKMNFGQNKVPLEAFLTIPSILQWEDLMRRRTVREVGINSRKRSLWYVCNYLHVHPDNLTVNQVADCVFEMKGRSDRGEPVPKGLAYSSTRVAIRSFFTLVLEISGEKLAAMGVDAAATKGAGLASMQSVTKMERHELETTLRQVCFRKFGPPNRPPGYAELIYDEILYFCKWMYYTGSRKTASFNITFEDPRHRLSPDLWSLHILDKGKKGGQHWDKILIAEALEDFKTFIARRHKIPLEYVDQEFRRRRGPIFPLVKKENRAAADTIKEALKLAGSPYFSEDMAVTYPCHIWRHTFAQEFLRASGWNYELTASLGGWASTAILKKHYGKMGMDVILNGLREAMGQEIVKETYRLLW